MRQATIRMVLATGDSEFVAQVRQVLLQDPVEHVRNDARRRCQVIGTGSRQQIAG